jgi:hypothetical protein
MAEGTETKETTATTEVANAETTSAAEQKPDGQAASDAVAVWREAYIESVKGQPGVIPELIAGDSLDAIHASVTAVRRRLSGWRGWLRRVSRLLRLRWPLLLLRRLTLGVGKGRIKGQSCRRMRLGLIILSWR